MAWDSDQDISGVFAEFGYTPTQAEIDALKPSFGEGFGGAVAVSAVGQYVNYQNQIKQFEANDPLNALQTRMNNIIDQNTASVKGLSQQLQDTLSAAPQLFGSLTPDQIQTYLKPLQDSFNTQLSTVQSTIASRGLAASSTENNALAQTNQQFQGQVLSTGLNIGLTSQQNKAQAIQQQINNLFGQTSQAMGISGQAAGQQSTQNLGESNLIASLPSFLNANSAQMAAFNKALNPNTGGFQNTFNQVTSDINAGTGAATNLLGKQGLEGIFGGTAPQAPTPYGTNPMAPSAASTSMGGANYQTPNLSLLQGNAASTPAEQYGFGSAGSATSLAGSGSLFA